MDSFRTWLVGGAVRDRLLGIEGGDRDFVVVGATPERMIEAGYRPVGNDFPVFLHPQTHEEYALARTERKSGRGYRGFTFLADPSVTLEEDLARRDLTINAIAQADDGSLIDPFGGAHDLEQRVLRHVSPAFAEDPVRILRIARFAARFAPLGFTIAPETMTLMRSMVTNGEVDHLVAERVWAELGRALAESSPQTFVSTLRECGALVRLLPEVDVLYGVPQRAEYHPEIDTGIHVEMVLAQAARLAPGDALVAWCALTHDLGKGVTDPTLLPRHHAHDAAGVPLVDAVSRRLKVPADFMRIARLVCRWHLMAHTALELRPVKVMALFERLDAFRRPDTLDVFLTACEADQRGRLGFEERAYPQADYLRASFAAARAISVRGLELPADVTGERIAVHLAEARTRAIAAVPKPEPAPVP